MTAVHQIDVLLGTFGECCECGTPIYGSVAMKRERIADHKTFYCINGHPQFFVAENPEEKLKKQLEQKQREVDVAKAREQMALNAAGTAQHTLDIVLGKHKKALLERIKNGACPFCSRSFVNVRRHMAKKHPETWAALKERTS